jgi:luciferase family oxidoreductase group 1
MSVPHQFKLSILDLTPISSGSTATDALKFSIQLAQSADQWGYHRYWFAEHHNTRTLASASPELMISQIAPLTKQIRVGAGGIMLPNHAPLKVAENFRLLEALFPGRIDLGLGRAPGTDLHAAMALRGTRQALNAQHFPDQMTELLGYLAQSSAESNDQKVRAVPLDVDAPEIWLLGSSCESARMAAENGLRFAYAQHINPAETVAALNLYHRTFQPSKDLPEPQSILAITVICAATQAEAERLASSADWLFLQIYQQNPDPGPLLSPEEVIACGFSAFEQQIIATNRSHFWLGTPSFLHKELSQFAENTHCSEIMISALIHDPETRRSSYQLLAETFGISRL